MRYAEEVGEVDGEALTHLLAFSTLQSIIIYVATGSEFTDYIT